MNLVNNKKITILGAGIMGAGMAQVFATAGYDVALYSIPHPTLDEAPAIIRASLETLAGGGYLDAKEIPAILGRIRTTTELTNAADGAEFIFEAIAERLDAKGKLYAELDGLCPPGTLFASNTSNLNIFAVMPERRLPGTVIAHFFAPAHIIPLVEIVRGDETADATVRSVRELLIRAGKVPMVINRYLPGFCINRLQRAVAEEVYNLLDNGYMTAEDLDIAVKASFIPRAMVLGLVQRYDFTGIDLSVQNIKNGDYTLPPQNHSPKCLMDLYEKGDFGVKTGRGFFDYAGRDKKEVLRSRDLALLRVLEAVQGMINERI